MKKIKIISFCLIVAFILSAFPKSDVFAISQADCEKYKNTCPDESLISQIKSVCGISILNSVNAACATEKANAEKRILELSSQKAQIEKKEGQVQWYLSNINSEIQKINAEIVNTDMTLDQVNNELIKLNDILSKQKNYLSALMRQVYEYDTTSYVEIFLGNISLSDFSDKISEVSSIQKNINDSLKGVMDAKEALEKKREEEFNYKALQESSRQSLAAKKNQQQYLLSQLKMAKTPIEREMARLQTEIQEIKSAMGRIQSYFGCWLTGGNPSWSQIFSAVSSGSSRAGVNMFTMLGILEVESSFRTCAGKNMGSPEGNLQRCVDNRTDDSYCYREKSIFEQICASVGADPNKVPISYAYAMGPAQFIPSTWRGYSQKYGVRNPWYLNDAVLAMTWKLKNGGIAGYNPGGASWYVPKVEAAAARWQEIYNACGGFNLSCPNLRNYLISKGIPTE
jgi:peptidoglycan hydrolase CwlO-like protein